MGLRIKKIEQYATLFVSRFQRLGYTVERDEVVGDLGEVYARCLNTYNESHENGASFDTYLVEAFKRHFERMRNKLDRTVRTIAVEEIENVPADIPCKCPIDRWATAEIKREIFARINNARRLIIFNEITDPSEKVLAVMESLRLLEGDRKMSCNHELVRAIALVYGYDEANITYHIRSIRRIAKKVLTCER